MSLDKADDKKKVLERSVNKLEKAIDEAKETIATLTDEIKVLAGERWCYCHDRHSHQGA